MGRPLGLRSEPYAAIGTADEDHDGTNNDDDLPTTPTIYQDDSGLSFEKDEEDYPNQGEDYDVDRYGHDHDDGYATQSHDLQHHLDTTESQTNERRFRVKFVVLFSFLAAMVIFGKEYYNINGNSKVISDEFTEEEFNGVRGKIFNDKPSSSTTTGGE